jgi:hypothetical protein
MRSLLALCGVVAFLAGASQAQQAVPPHPRLPECQQNDPTLLMPDLVPEVPADVRTVLRGSSREIVFTTAIGNIGPGPLILEGMTVSTSAGIVTAAYQHINRRDGSQCAHSAGLFVFHPQHKHWHFDSFVAYELRADDPNTGPLAGGGEKMSYCLLDIRMVRGFNPQQFPRQVLTQRCSSADGIYGISVGWEDVYERFLPGQSINLDPDPNHQVPTGAYFLVNKVNPDGRIWESNLANNTSFTSVGVVLPPVLLTGPLAPTPTPGPAKNPQLPHMRPGRVRPTRPPRGPHPATAPTPLPTPTRAVEAAPTPTAVPNLGTHGPHQPHAPKGPHNPT